MNLMFCGAMPLTSWVWIAENEAKKLESPLGEFLITTQLIVDKENFRNALIYQATGTNYKFPRDGRNVEKRFSMYILFSAELLDPVPGHNSSRNGFHNTQ
jgi:hypothetical protein